MSKEVFNLEEKEKMDLLKELPRELQEKHADKSIEELKQIINTRKSLGSAPDISKKLHITEQLEVETEKTHKEEIKEKIERGPEQP